MTFARYSIVGAVLVAATSPAHAQDLTIKMGELPPHIDSDGSGREAELIRSVAEACGWTVSFEVEPFTRHWRSFQDGAGDAVGTVPVGMDLGGTATDAYVEYRNGVTVLDQSGLAPSSLDDLSGLSVVTFAGAEGILPGLPEAKSTFSDYREVADQLTHSRMLFGERVDAVLGEGMIVAEYNHRLASDADSVVDATQPATFTPIFEATPYTMVFRDAELAAAFDTCLEQASDQVDTINADYVARYRDVIGDAYGG